ncbi:MAG: nuclear transport factor 2 family protein [Myxococcales bacterium]|nr:nuclear transport factor 2 family protein [Myxococcales bacterium]
MSAEANKAVIRDYFERVQRGDPAVADLIAEDASWWVPPASPLGGVYEGKARVLELMGSGVDLYDPAVPMQIQVEEMVAEGEWVCVQLVIEAATARGEPYRNHYHFAFRLRDGKIIIAKEYVDTLYAQRMLFDPALSDAP